MDDSSSVDGPSDEGEPYAADDPSNVDEPTTPAGHRLATLCFPIVGDEVLLIYKKRGIGADLYNGPGGKVEPGESPRECAVRETREEVRAVPRDVRKVGELDFRFGEEPFTYVHVYRADGLDGTPDETPEARPEWFSTDEIPYDEMWEDDRYWLPHLLDGESFHGRFRFDEAGEQLLEWELETGAEL